MRKSLLPVLILPLLSGPAVGQALKGHNAKAPVDVAADRIEVQDRADRAFFIGNVQVQQAGLSLSAARLTVAYDRSGSGTEIERLDASGGVTVTSADQTARGDVAIYDLPRRLITMLGGVTLVQGGNRVSGGRLVIDLNSGRATVDGSGVGTPGVSGSRGRVTGRFIVTNKGQ
jgi:lipopolysaccharide export system protein LptA